MSRYSDGGIIRLARDSPAMFGELYDRHAAAVFRYAARRAGDFAAAVSTGLIALALKSMPAIDRETLLLYAWGDLTYEGIAVAMDVPIGTVRSRLNRARRALRRELDLSQFEDRGEEAWTR